MALAPARVSVSTSATLLAADADAGSVLVCNRGTSAVYLGDPTVTSSSGFQLDAGASVSVDLLGEALYAIAASGTQSVHVLRVGV